MINGVFALLLVLPFFAAGAATLDDQTSSAVAPVVTASPVLIRVAAEGLPADAPNESVLITVDTSKNMAYLFRDNILVAKSPAATGSGKLLKKGLRSWLFYTPRGKHQIVRKIVSPIWTKPDWAYLEEGKPVPPMNAKSRKVAGKLGKYALDLGDGIMVHGTDEPDSLGKKVSHGCIRVGDKMLAQAFRAASVGTYVYIY